MSNKLPRENGTWSFGTPMPTPRCHYGSVMVDNKIYCIGGSKTYNIVATDTVEIYDITSDTWSVGPNLPEARVMMGCAVIENCIYCLGGRKLDNSFPRYSYIYDIENKTWCDGPEIPESVMGQYCISVGPHIYMLGGFNPEKSFVDNLYIYDSEFNTWTVGEPLPIRRAYFGACTVDGKVYCIGSNQLSPRSPRVDIYDIDSDTWSLGTNSPVIKIFTNPCPLNNYIYNLGGQGVDNEIEEVTEVYSNLRYDTKAKTWALGPAIPQPVIDASSYSYNDAVYCIGGRVVTDKEVGNPVALVQIYTPKDENNGDGGSDKCNCCTEVEIRIKTCTKKEQLLRDINEALIEDGKNCPCDPCC